MLFRSSTFVCCEFHLIAHRRGKAYEKPILDCSSTPWFYYSFIQTASANKGGRGRQLATSEKEEDEETNEERGSAAIV